LLYTPAATVSHQGDETGAMVAGLVAAVDSSLDLENVVGAIGRAPIAAEQLQQRRRKRPGWSTTRVPIFRYTIWYRVRSAAAEIVP